MHIRKGGEEKERRGKGEKNRSGTKKKQKRWRKAVRSKSWSVFTHLGMGSDALWRHWAVVTDASGNQTSTPPQLGILFPLMLWLEWMDKRTRQTHGICLLCWFPSPFASYNFSFCMLSLEPALVKIKGNRHVSTGSDVSQWQGSFTPNIERGVLDSRIF